MTVLLHYSNSNRLCICVCCCKIGLVPEERRVGVRECRLEGIPRELDGILIGFQDWESVLKDVLGELRVDECEFFVEDFEEEVLYEGCRAELERTIRREHLRGVQESRMRFEEENSIDDFAQESLELRFVQRARQHILLNRIEGSRNLVDCEVVLEIRFDFLLEIQEILRLVDDARGFLVEGIDRPNNGLLRRFQ